MDYREFPGIPERELPVALILRRIKCWGSRLLASCDNLRGGCSCGNGGMCYYKTALWKVSPGEYLPVESRPQGDILPGNSLPRRLFTYWTVSDGRVNNSPPLWKIRLPPTPFHCMKMSPLSKHRSLPLDTMRKAHYNFSPAWIYLPCCIKYTMKQLPQEYLLKFGVGWIPWYLAAPRRQPHRRSGLATLPSMAAIP